MEFECKPWHLRRGGQKSFCDPIGAREPRLSECFDFPFDVIFDAANRECGAIESRGMMQTYQQCFAPTDSRPSCSSRLAAQAWLPQLIGVAILARRRRAKYHQVTRRQVLGG